MSGRRLDVSAVQAVSSMLAAITGAIAASGLGIAGTLVGAAFMSLASTVGAAVYRHYISRSNERLRAAAASLAPKASGSVVAAALVRHHQPPGAGPATTGSVTMAGPAAGSAAAGAGSRTSPAGARPESTTQPAQSLAAGAAPEAGEQAAMPDWAYAADAAGTTVIPALAARSARPQPGSAGTQPGESGHQSAGGGSQPDGAGSWPGQGAYGGPATGTRREADAGDPDEMRSLPGDGRTAIYPEPAPADDVTRTWFRDTAPASETRSAAAADTPPAAEAAAAMAGTGTVTSPVTTPGPGHSGSWVDGSGEAGPASGGPGPSRGPAGGRRRWLIAVLAAAGVFVIAMGAVTAIEAIAGKPLETVIWHKKGSGTTVGGLVGGPAQRRHSPAPSTSPSAPASPSSTPATTPPATPTPTPTGSGSTAPSPTPSGSAPASPAPSGSGAAG